MKIETYFKKNGEIYGHMYKGPWNEQEHRLCRFIDFDEALRWAKAIDPDGWKKELITKSDARYYESAQRRKSI